MKSHGHRGVRQFNQLLTQLDRHKVTPDLRSELTFVSQPRVFLFSFLGVDVHYDLFRYDTWLGN